MHQPVAIERDTSRDAEITCKRNRFFEWSYPINNTFESAGNKHLAIGTKSDASGIWNVARVLRNIATDVDAKERDGQFFTT